MSADPVNVELEFDRAQLAALKRTVGPALYEKAVDKVLVDATHLGEGAAKEETPVRTGHARRSSVSDAKAHEVRARYPYFEWLDTGEDRAGRKMASRPGGYQISRQTRAKVEANLPKLVDRVGREIAQRWAE